MMADQRWTRIRAGAIFMRANGEDTHMKIGGLLAVAGAMAAAGANAQTAPVLTGSPGDFVGADAYPPAAIRAGAEGKTVARLDIDTAGVVRACTIEARRRAGTPISTLRLVAVPGRCLSSQRVTYAARR
jgi:hypothetical protein